MNVQTVKIGSTDYPFKFSRAASIRALRCAGIGFSQIGELAEKLPLEAYPEVMLSAIESGMKITNAKHPPIDIEDVELWFEQDFQHINTFWELVRADIVGPQLAEPDTEADLGNQAQPTSKA